MIALLAGLMLAAATPAPPSSPFAACPHENVRVVEESNFAFPENAHPTHPRVRFVVDLGSDGRVRRTVTVESSGDPAVDAAAAKAIAEFRFAPQSAGCVSVSGLWSQWWDMPPETIVSPAPATSAAPSASPSPAACAAPLVRPYRLALPPHRAAPGTAAVDVALDANARVTGVHLAQSSGNSKTDYTATIAARNTTYVFERQPGCAVTPTTYRLEMTFH